MAVMALVSLALIGLVIYSLSQVDMTKASSASPLKDLTIQTTLRQNLPQFEYSGEGKSLKEQNFEGRWTLLTFWAYWCEPCLEEMPALNALAQQWQGPEFEIITVNVDDPKSENFEAAKRLLSEENITLPTLFDHAGDLKRAFKVENLPQHFLISPDKKIVWQDIGAFRWNEPKARDQLLKIMEDASESATESESTEAAPEE